MSYLLSTFTEVAEIDSRITSGLVTLPLTSSIPNRTFTVKDFYGAASNSTIILQTQFPDVFENGLSNLVINNNFGAVTLYAGDVGIWNVLTGSIQNSMTVSSLVTSTMSISSYTFAINSNSFTIQNNTSTLLRLTGGNVNVSSITLSSFSLYDSGLLSNVNIRLSSLTLLANNSSISGGGGGGSIDTSFITSTVAGLGSLGYLSTAVNLQSTVAGLGQTYISTILVGSNYINSTVTGLGSIGYLSTAVTSSNLTSTVTGLGSYYVSTTALTSTVAGLGETYVSSVLVGSNYINSTVTGLGQTYVSTASLTSTIAGLGQTYISTLVVTPTYVTSTVTGLGSYYISSTQLQSTVAGLGQTYISAPLNLARISSLTVSTLALSTFTLFAQGPSSLVITNSNPGNFIVSSMNLGINTGQPLYPLDVNGTANFSSISLGSGNASMLVKAQSLAIGYQVGAYGLTGTNTLAVGYQAGFSNQGNSALAIGQTAGSYSQGISGVALGNAAGYSNQGPYATAIGYQAGFVAQCNLGVAIGYTAGYSNQGSNSVAIGNAAGFSNQSTNSVAIGWLAGQGTTATSSIILNASGSALNSSSPGLFVSPVRFVTGAGNIVHFNTATSEIAYSDTTQLTSITAVNGSLTGTLTGGVPSFTVSTLAGAAAAGSSNGTGDTARFWQPKGTCVDTSGNIFVVDTGFSIIRKIVIATGVVTTLAGTPSSYGSNDGIGAAAQFYFPQGMCYDGNGNLFVADVANQKIRKIVIATSNVTTFAGSGAIGASNAVGTLASFNYPQYITYDGIGSLFVTDNNNRLIRRINTTTSNVTSFAGGTNGSNDGVGLSASFNWIQGICSDSAGANLYVADASNNNIRRINIATSNVTTIAGITTPGSNDGIGAAARFTGPYDITADSTGNLFVADSGNNKIRKIVLSTSNVTTVAGTGGTTFADGAASLATFNDPQGITVNSLGQIFIGDRGNNRIRLLSPLQPLIVSSNVIMNSEVNMVGRVGIGGSANSSNALFVTGSINFTGSLFSNGSPFSSGAPGINSSGNIGINSASNTSNALLVTGTQSNTGNLFIGGTTFLVASSNTGTLGVAGLTTLSNTSNTGTLGVAGVTTLSNTSNAGTLGVAGLTTLSNTSNTGTLGVAGVTTLSNTSNTGTLTVTGATTLGSVAVNKTQTNNDNLFANANMYAGFIPGTLPTSTSVTTLATGFNNPHCACIDPTGTTLYVTNFNTSQIFAVSVATGVATVLSTSGTATTNPTGICIDPSGQNLYVFLFYGNSILKITLPGGVASVFAGGTQGSTNGTGTGASFFNARSMCINPAGTIIYLMDTGNNHVRAITVPGAVVTTIISSGITNGFGICINRAGTTLYVADYVSIIYSISIASPSLVTVATTSGNTVGIAVDTTGQNLYITRASSRVVSFVVISSGVVTTIAGSGATGSNDGPGTTATFAGPQFIVSNFPGNLLYVLDGNNGRIRTVALAFPPSLSVVGGYVGIGAAANTSNALLVTGSINFTGSLFSNGTLFSGGSVAGINSSGNIGVNSASNSSNALFVSGSQSNTGALFVGGATTLGGRLGIFSSSPSAQLDILGGSTSDGSGGSNMLAFQFSTGGYRHFIRSRHNAVVGSPLNAIDFWLNNTTTDTGSSTAGTGNVNSMSVTASGVGINCNAPGYNLDVNGTTNLNGAVRFKTNVSHIGDDGKAKVFYASNSATYYLATSHIFQTPTSVNTFTVDSSGNTSNTGTIGVAGTATFSSNVSTRSFTNGRFDIYPTTANNYTIMGLSGGNNTGFIYGDYQLLNDGIHMGYNYYGSNGVAYSGGGGTNFSVGASRISVGYGTISLNVGLSANLSTMVGITTSRVSIGAVTTDYGLFAPTPTFVSSIAFTSTYNDLLNGAPAYGIGRATSGITGLGPYTVAAGQLPLQIANYHGISFVGGQALWGAGVSHMAIVDGKVGIQNPAPSYTLDVNGPIQAAIFYSTITSGGTQTVTPNNFGIFYNITVAGTFTLAFAASQATSNIGKYICVRNNCGSTLSFTLTGVSGITSPVTLSNAQSATFVVATTTTYALF